LCNFIFYSFFNFARHGKAGGAQGWLG